jgi:FAD-dependent urate hydroxylase
MNTTRTALVIGGGIAGPVAAMALQKAGIRAHVYEAHPGAADGVGGALGLAPNGINALAVIGAEHLVERIGDPMRAMAIESWTGKLLAQLPSPPGLPTMQLVWRSELYRALHDEAAARGIPTEPGKRLVGISEDESAVTAHFADGTSASADVLIAADGIRSTARTLIDPHAPAPRYAGLLNFGARLRDSPLPSTGGTMHMVFGKRAFLGYQIEDGGRGGWFVNLPHRDPATLAEVRRTPPEAWLRILRDALAGDRAPGLALLEATDPAHLLVIGPMEDVPTVPVWHRGRTVLVGDAAHATSPSSGQGASLAAESAIQLARALRDLPHPRAFAAYEQLRRARVEKIIAAAARTNQNKAAGPVARVLRDLLLPTAMKMLAKPEKSAWQYGYRIDWDAPVTDADAVAGAGAGAPVTASAA